MSLAKLKRELKKMPKEEIINLISDLYSKVPSAKDFFNVFVTADVSGLIEKHKKEIERLVYPRGNNFNTKEVEARKLIRNLRKMKIDELSIALELHYVHCCLDVIEGFGYWNERYYVAAENMFYDAENKILANGWEDKYDEQLNSLTNRANEVGMLEY